MMRVAATLFFLLTTLPASAASTPPTCSGQLFASVGGDGHTRLSLTQFGSEYDRWQPANAFVSGSRIQVTEAGMISDVAGVMGCGVLSVDLGVLTPRTYEVSWTLDRSGFTPTGKLPLLTYATTFVLALPQCTSQFDAVARLFGPNVQIDVTEQTRAAEFGVPVVARNGSHFTIEHSERVNSIAIIETALPYHCYSHTFFLGTLPEGDYDVTVTRPIDDTGYSRTVTASAVFHVETDTSRRRGVRH